MKKLIEHYSDIILVGGEITKIEEFKGASDRRIVTVATTKGVKPADRKMGRDFIEIPLIVQDIVVIREREDDNINLLDNKAIGTGKDLKVGENYLFLADLTRVKIPMADKNRRITAVDVKGIYKGEEYDVNYVSGKYTLLAPAKMTETRRDLYGNLRLMSRGRIVGYSRGKHANFASTLKKGDKVNIQGTLYATKYEIIDDFGNANPCDSFAVYLSNISLS